MRAYPQQRRLIYSWDSVSDQAFYFNSTRISLFRELRRKTNVLELRRIFCTEIYFRLQRSSDPTRDTTRHAMFPIQIMQFGMIRQLNAKKHIAKKLARNFTLRMNYFSIPQNMWHIYQNFCDVLFRMWNDIFVSKKLLKEHLLSCQIQLA